LSYAVSVVAFCFLLSSFFNKGKVHRVVRVLVD
jgi:hypothetical protein